MSLRLSKKFFLFAVFLLIIVLSLIVKFNITPLLQKTLTDELKDITGMEVSIEKIYINLIPLKLEAENILIRSSEEQYLKIDMLKLYPGFVNFFNKEIPIRRVVIYKGEYSFDYQTINKTIKHIEDYLEKPSKFPFKFKFNNIELNSITGSLLYDNDLNLRLSEIHSRLNLKSEPEISFISNVKIISSKYPNVDTNLKAFFKIRKSELFIKELKIFDANSLVKSEGKLDYSKFLGEFIISGKLFLKSLMKFFGLTPSGYGEINIDGKINLVDEKKWLDKINLDLSFGGEFFLEELMQILKVSEKLNGWIEISKGKLQGPLSDFQVQAKANLKNGNILGIQIEKLNAKALYKKGILEFTDGDVNLYGGKAKAHVWITLPKVTEHYVFVELNNISSSGVFDLIHWNAGIAEGKVKGWISSQGKEFSPCGSFVYMRTAKTPEDLRGKINWIQGDFDTVNNVYRFKTLDFSLNKTQAHAEGYVDIKNNYLSFNFKGKSNDIDELLIPYQKGIHGDANITGSIYGGFDNPEIKMNFTSNDINIIFDELQQSIKNQSISFNNITGSIVYNKNTLVSNISANDFSIKGKILFPNAKYLFELQNPIFDMEFFAKNIPIKNFYVQAFNDGINTNLNLKGHIKERGTVTAELYSEPIFIGTKKILDKISADIAINKDSLHIKRAEFFANKQSLHASGYLNFDGNINLSGASKLFDITQLAQKYTDKLGVKYLQQVNLDNLKFILQGILKNPKFTADSNLNVKVRNGKNISGNLSVHYEDNNISIKSLLQKNISLVVEGIPTKSVWQFRGNIKSARVDSFIAMFINNLPEDLVVLLDGKINGEIVGEKLNAQIDMNRIFGRMYGMGFSNKNLAKINIKDGNVYIEPIILIGQSTELTIKGRIVDYFDILLDGNSDLRPFKTLFKVDDLRGRASMQVYIYGSKKHPEIAGEIEINNATVTLSKDIPSFSNINAIISFDENRLILEKAYGDFSQGKVDASGTIYLENFGVKQFAVSGKISDIRWIFTPKCWAYMDGQLYLTGDYNQPILSGIVKVNRGVYEERFDWTKLALSNSSAKAVTSSENFLNRLKFNVRIQANNFFVNNNLAIMTLNSDLLLRGSLHEPSFLGWINAKSGWVYFRGNRFEILRLLAQFTESSPTNPYINLSARTIVDKYNVSLNINGYIDQFNLLLSSNPPLSEQELLNLLVLGQSSGGIPGTSEAASFITGQMQETIQERIRGITGLDVMTVEPTISKNTGSITPKVTVGKKLMDGKMIVTYSTATGENVEHIFKIEYFIKKGISLVGIRDEIGGLSGAIKFRFEFR